MALMRERKLCHGWLFMESKRIAVQLRSNGVEQPRAVFPHSEEGAQKAADFITKHLGHDDWTLEPSPMPALGYRIRG